MIGEERRKTIAKLLGKTPLSASKLAEHCGVSRQVIVQDIALMRAEGAKIIATNRGYIAAEQPEVQLAVLYRRTHEGVRRIDALLPARMKFRAFHHIYKPVVKAADRLEFVRARRAYREHVKSPSVPARPPRLRVYAPIITSAPCPPRAAVIIYPNGPHFYEEK